MRYLVKVWGPNEEYVLDSGWDKESRAEERAAELNMELDEDDFLVEVVEWTDPNTK